MDHMPTNGEEVTVGASTYIVVRPGCATHMKDCPNGDNAVTVRKPTLSDTWGVCVSFAQLEQVPIE